MNYKWSESDDGVIKLEKSLTQVAIVTRLSPPHCLAMRWSRIAPATLPLDQSFLPVIRNNKLQIRSSEKMTQLVEQ